MAVNACDEISTMRTIKKYSNRRLYDTTNSCFVTLSEVRKMVLDYEDIVVLDAENGDDITRNILLHILSEQELGGQPMFSTDLLIQLIRISGGAFQNVFTDYMEKAMKMVADQQQAHQREVAAMMNSELMSKMSDMAMQNIKVWSEAQQEFLKGYGFKPPKDDK